MFTFFMYETQAQAKARGTGLYLWGAIMRAKSFGLPVRNELSRQVVWPRM